MRDPVSASVPSRKGVLVSRALQPFLTRESVPADFEAALFDALPTGIARSTPESPTAASAPVVALIPHVQVPVGARELDALPHLRIVANYGVGYDNIDVAAARARGVVVTNTPGVLTDATAELTWALILAAARRIGEGERMVRAGAWAGWTPTQLLGMSLTGATLGIVGAGRIGRDVARRAGAFGMRVVYWSRARQPEMESAAGARLMDLRELLAASDVVSVHVALNEGTRALLGADAIACMRRGAILVNTSRGAVVDEDALADALESGHLRAAGLDVYAEEPRVPERLRKLENVVLLPHLGSATDAARQAMWELAWKNVVEMLVRGEALTPVA